MVEITDEVVEVAIKALAVSMFGGDVELIVPDDHPAKKEWFSAIRAALTAAAPLLVAAERERCAKIAEARDLSIMSSTAVDIEARKIAAAIRDANDV